MSATTTTTNLAVVAAMLPAWFPPEKLCIPNLCRNPSEVAMELLDKVFFDSHFNEIDWNALCGNEKAIPLLEKRWTTAKPRMNWRRLCFNPAMVPFSEKYWDEVNTNIDWQALCTVPDAMDLIEQYLNGSSDHPENWPWGGLCQNTAAMHLIETHCGANFENIHRQFNWPLLLMNPSAVPFIERHWEHINNIHMHIWMYLCHNPNAMHLVEERMEMYPSIFHDHNIMWGLCNNPNAIAFIEKHWTNIKDYLDWNELGQNPNVVSLFENHPELLSELAETHWFELSANPNMLPFLLRHWDQVKDKVKWVTLSANPAVFENELLRKELQDAFPTSALKEELMRVVWHPRNLQRMHDNGHELFDEEGDGSDGKILEF